MLRASRMKLDLPGIGLVVGEAVLSEPSDFLRLQRLEQ